MGSTGGCFWSRGAAGTIGRFVMGGTGDSGVSRLVEDKYRQGDKSSGPGFDPNSKSRWAVDKKCVRSLLECASRFKRGDIGLANAILRRMATKRRTRAEYYMFGVDSQKQVVYGIATREGHVRCPLHFSTPVLLWRVSVLLRYSSYVPFTGVAIDANNAIQNLLLAIAIVYTKLPLVHLFVDILHKLLFTTRCNFATWENRSTNKCCCRKMYYIYYKFNCNVSIVRQVLSIS